MVQLILKEQQEREQRQTAYTWRKEQTSWNRVTYQSCGPVGPKPFPHPTSPVGGREMNREGVEGLGLLNT